jgi:glycogen debranching enzyme
MYERHNLVRANSVCGFDPEVCMKKNFWVKDVPFNTILLRNLEILGEIATLLKDTKGIEFATRNAELLRQAMREHLLADGVFWSGTGENHELLKVATWAHFIPLFAGLYTQEEAQAVIGTHFHDQHTFRSPYGIRTVSQKETSYRASGFWRGPIWMAPHWFIYHGLKRYGFVSEASWLAIASRRLIERNGFREYFNPETGKAYGAHNFTWGTLVLDMMDI